MLNASDSTQQCRYMTHPWHTQTLCRHRLVQVYCLFFYYTEQTTWRRTRGRKETRNRFSLELRRSRRRCGIFRRSAGPCFVAEIDVGSCYRSVGCGNDRIVMDLAGGVKERGCGGREGRGGGGSIVDLSFDAPCERLGAYDPSAARVGPSDFYVQSPNESDANLSRQFSLAVEVFKL